MRKIGTLSLVLLQGCAPCETSYEVTGSVDGIDIASDNYRAEATWPEPTESRLPVGPLVEALGLDPDDAADVARVTWLSQGADLNFWLAEFNFNRIRQRYEVFFFGLDEYDVQPGHTAPVLNLGTLAQTLQAGTPEEIRQALDTVRQLDQPQVAVAFATDLDDESVSQLLFHYLTDSKNRWATEGSVTLDGVRDLQGEVLDDIVHPAGDIGRVSVSGDPSFGTDQTRFEAECVRVQRELEL